MQPIQKDGLELGITHFLDHIPIIMTLVREELQRKPHHFRHFAVLIEAVPVEPLPQINLPWHSHIFILDIRDVFLGQVVQDEVFERFAQIFQSILQWDDGPLILFSCCYDSFGTLLASPFALLIWRGLFITRAS